MKEKITENITLYHDDCFNVMHSLPKGSVDLIVTDPPYLFKNGGAGHSELCKRAENLKDNIDFISEDFDWEKCFEMFLELQRTPNMIIFCSNKQLSRTMKFFEDKGLRVSCLVWHKLNPIPLVNNKYMEDVEFVVRVSGEGATFNNECPFDYKRKVYTSGIVSNKNRLHPTQKDLKHISQFIELHSKEGDLVFDAFMGSGTTPLACHLLNRKCIGVELDPHFYGVAAKRLKENAQQLKLF